MPMTPRSRLIHQHDVDLRNVGHPGEQIHLHVRIHHLAGVPIEDAILEQREVQRADDAAVDLAFGEQLVDDQPAVLHGEDPLDLDDAGFDVDVHFGELHAARAG